MAISIMDMAPFLPTDRALTQSALPDKAVALVNQSARLAGQLSPLTLVTLSRHMLAINAYYSNLIEGNATRPHEIRAAQRGDYSGDPAKRDLHLESQAHMRVQQWLREKNPNLDTLYSDDFIRTQHREFYSRVPENLWNIKNQQDDIADKIVPGEWRKRRVRGITTGVVR